MLWDGYGTKIDSGNFSPTAQPIHNGLVFHPNEDMEIHFGKK
jgi:hypothetical protein